MSSSIAYDAIKARLVDQFGGTYPVRDFEEIETGLQQETTPWLAVDDSEGGTTLESIGTPDANWTRDIGFVVVHVFVPSSGSLAAARGIIDMIRTAMQYYRFSVPEDHTLRCMTVSPPGPGVVHEGLWHSMITTIDFEHQFPVATAT